MVYFSQIKSKVFLDILYSHMDPTRVCIEITYFSIFFKFLMGDSKFEMGDRTLPFDVRGEVGQRPGRYRNYS